ncbi:putative cytokinetic ring protein SteA [Nocardioides marinisabuli]|uniref:putative cytokinetic ring protein SteA n=1 Tax=Nocardioides marinisabuli TaxID=419476 RepID=UPI0015DD64EA|nr:putative cytokinetic ring protein SteA [Nocardioides marinisabuli]
MKLSVRRRPAPVLPGLTATARVERRPRTLLSRLRPGDVAVVDHSDLDRATAQSLVDAGVVAVVNAAPMMSGRYPAQGPGLLAQHGVLLLDRVGAAAGGVEDGSSVRLHESALHLDDGRVLEGRLLALTDLEEETERARLGLASQLETLTHNAAELLRREEELLLHGRGLPALATRFEGRAAVVAVEGPELAAELALVTPYVREQHPVVIAVHQAADRLAAAGLQPDVVVVDGRSDLDPPRPRP